MSMAVALLLIVVASVLFHVFNPWWTTPLASNWQQMDDTLTITLVITGTFFVAINLFVVYALVRFRHREGRRRDAAEPENKRLERWLIGGTTVGIMALLAPGLVVYANYVQGAARRAGARGAGPAMAVALPASRARTASWGRATRASSTPPTPSASTRPTPPGRTTCWSRPTRCTCRWAGRCWC